jgi:hypothetical protein
MKSRTRSREVEICGVAGHRCGGRGRRRDAGRLAVAGRGRNGRRGAAATAGGEQHRQREQHESLEEKGGTHLREV